MYSGTTLGTTPSVVLICSGLLNTTWPEDLLHLAHSSRKTRPQWAAKRAQRQLISENSAALLLPGGEVHSRMCLGLAGAGWPTRINVPLVACFGTCTRLNKQQPRHRIDTATTVIQGSCLSFHLVRRSACLAHASTIDRSVTRQVTLAAHQCTATIHGRVTNFSLLQRLLFQARVRICMMLNLFSDWLVGMPRREHKIQGYHVAVAARTAALEVVSIIVVGDGICGFSLRRVILSSISCPS